MSPEPVLARRSLLRAGLVMGATAPWGLAACGDDEPAARTDGPVAAVSVLNAPLNADPEMLRFFPIDTGLGLGYEEYTDLARVVPGRARELFGAASPVDVLILPDRVLAEVAAAQPLPLLPEPLNTPTLPEFAPVAFDPQRRSTRPWIGRLMAIASRGAALRGGASVEVLFDPAYRGRVTLHADPRVTLGTIALADGYAAAGPARPQLEAALARVEDAVAGGQVRAFATTEIVDHLASGRAALALGSAPDVLLAGFAVDDLRVTIPEEGAVVDGDSAVVTAPTPERADRARRFLEYAYNPLAGARTVVLTQAWSPVPGSGDQLRSIDPQLLARPVLNPPPSLLQRVRMAQAVPPEVAAAFADLVARTRR